MKNMQVSVINQSQSGAVLITALVFLAILTLLALTSMNTTTLEEKMAANSQEINRVFQASESGLSTAFNDNAAFSTANTSVTPYAPPATQIGDYLATVNFSVMFVQATKPPRESGFEVGKASAYHFDFQSQANSTAGSASNLNMGAYQIGPAVN